MGERIFEQLENVPCFYEDAFGELLRRVNLRQKELKISGEEKQRLEYELDVVKRAGIAKIFLFGHELSFCHNNCVTLGVEGYSYINYLLGISKVNPVRYNLPFERFFNNKKSYLPSYYFYVKRGDKGLFLKEVYKRIGQGNVAKALDSDVYFVSAKGMEGHLIKNAVIIANENQQAYSESVSVMLAKELAKLNYYSFSILEVERIETIAQKEFSETEILEKAKELFEFYLEDAPEFFGVKEVEVLLKNTENKLIYQDQLLEILNKVFNFNMAEADYIRLEMAKRKRASLKDLHNMLINRFGEEGKNLFEYFFFNASYTIAKAYVIANLQTHVELD